MSPPFEILKALKSTEKRAAERPKRGNDKSAAQQLKEWAKFMGQALFQYFIHEVRRRLNYAPCLS